LRLDNIDSSKEALTGGSIYLGKSIFDSSRVVSNSKTALDMSGSV
jgi:hypothetical protein